MKGKGIQLEDDLLGTQTADLKVIVVRGSDGLINEGIALGNTLRQNQALIITANPGEFMFNPTVGVGIQDLILDDDYLRFSHRISDHLSKDGMKVKSLQLEKNKPLLLDAPYE